MNSVNTYIVVCVTQFMWVNKKSPFTSLESCSLIFTEVQYLVTEGYLFWKFTFVLDLEI